MKDMLNHGIKILQGKTAKIRVERTLVIVFTKLHCHVEVGALTELFPFIWIPAQCIEIIVLLKDWVFFDHPA
jgi:hypothetical protein